MHDDGRYDNLTDKQYRILTVICDGNKDVHGKWETNVDMDELLERVSYRTSKDSMRISIRKLVDRKLISKVYESRRGCSRAVYIPSLYAKQMMGYHDPSFIQSQDLTYLEI